MPANRADERIWGAASAGQFAALEGDIKADVVVIGAGFIGLAAALELVAAGRSVAILDAGEIGGSASAISAGHVGPMLYGARKGPDDIVKQLGLQMGDRLNARVALAGSTLFDTIAQHQIQCAARPGYVGVYRTERSLERASQRFDSWAKFGGRVRRLSKAQVRDHIVSDRYAGGFLIEDGGWVDPLKLLEGLARGASTMGVAVYTGSRVVSANRDAKGWVVQTGSGAALSANDVILATGAVTPDFAGAGIAGSTIRLACGIAASDPDESSFARLLPSGGPIADFDDPAVFAPVVDNRQRLVVSMLMRNPEVEARPATEPAKARLNSVFGEAISFPTFDAGVIPVTLDGLPNLIRRDDGLIAVTGCNGFGMTLGMVAAREAARLVLGTPVEQLALPVKAPKAVRAGSLLSGVMRNIVIPLANRFGK
ncbi:MAG: FAD-binding oxidoreductase [Sphingomicrobium sp.]